MGLLVLKEFFLATSRMGNQEAFKTFGIQTGTKECKELLPHTWNFSQTDILDFFTLCDLQGDKSFVPS